MIPKNTIPQQQHLTDFDIQVDRRPIPSATREAVYHVHVNKSGKYICEGSDGQGCEQFRFRGHISDCRHILEFKNQKSQEIIQYLRTRYERDSMPYFPSFEMILARYKWKPDMEYNIIKGLYLSIAMANDDGTVTADDIHDAVGEQFVGDPRKIGSIQTGMTREGLLEYVCTIRSERERCHHRPIRKMRITEKGKQLLMDMT